MDKKRERGTLEIYTGAGTIFGVSGGVMEAALRTAYFVLSGEELKNADIEIVRGHNNAIVEATIPVPIKAKGGQTVDIRICVVNGANQGLEEVLHRVRLDKNRYHFIEVMNCPGGCVNGGGQPQQPGPVRNTTDIRALRAQVLYDSDKDNPIRKSHENPAIKELYDTDLYGQFRFVNIF